MFTRVGAHKRRRRRERARASVISARFPVIVRRVTCPPRRRNIHEDVASPSADPYFATHTCATVPRGRGFPCRRMINDCRATGLTQPTAGVRRSREFAAGPAEQSDERFLSVGTARNDAALAKPRSAVSRWRSNGIRKKKKTVTVCFQILRPKSHRATLSVYLSLPRDFRTLHSVIRTRHRCSCAVV